MVDQKHFQFAKELSNIYPYPTSQFLFMMIPPYLKKVRKLDLQKEITIINKDEPGQRVACESDDIAMFIKADEFGDRYLKWRNLVKENLTKGSVLILFPQLTYLNQAKKILEIDFGEKITVIHSQENEKMLYLNWQKTRTK